MSHVKPAVGAVAVVAFAMLVAACQNDTAPPTTTTTTSSTSTTTSSPPTTSATTPPEVPTPLPPAAKAHTDAGAVAFVKYYFQMRNLAFTQPNDRVLRTLFLESCAVCKKAQSDTELLVREGQKVNGDLLTLTSFEAGGKDGHGWSRVYVAGQQNQVDRLNADGSVVGTIPAGPVKWSAFAEWRASGWVMATVLDAP